MKRSAAAAAALSILIGAGCAATAEEPNCDDGQCDQDVHLSCEQLQEQTYDYIVVGSGAGGGPLASRLALANKSVLLLEAGEDVGGSLKYQIPVLHGMATEDPALAWNYYVDHYTDPSRAQRDSKFSCRNPQTDAIVTCAQQPGGSCVCPSSHPERLGIMYPRGAALGGSTAVNAMIAVLPSNRDWDAIAAETGDSTWSAGNMAKYFGRVKQWLTISKADPKLAATDLKIVGILVGSVVEFVASGGWTDGPSFDVLNLIGNSKQIINLLLKDVNERLLSGASSVGMWSFPLAINNGVRNGTREFILRTIGQGKPLTLRTGALVTNVVFADQPGAGGKPRAIGVDFMLGGHPYRAGIKRDIARATSCRIEAKREVILSAGAFNTPQLLKLSGIGPAAELAQHKIPVVEDLPGVGENLQDRYEVGVVSELEDSFPLLDQCTFTLDSKDPCFDKWQDRKGAYATNGALTSMMLKSTPDKPEADLHIFGVPGLFKGYYHGYSKDALAKKNRFTWVILKGHTENRAGQVKLRSANPTDWPAINFHYFDEGHAGDGQLGLVDEDVEAVVAGIEFIRRVGTRTNDVLLFDSFTELWPGPQVDTHEKLVQWVKDEAWGHHASCSARIGRDGDPMAVLDSRFRVRGVSGLRVVDASVFPRIPGTFIVLPTYMISEKAADVIIEDAKSMQ